MIPALEVSVLFKIIPPHPVFAVGVGQVPFKICPVVEGSGILCEAALRPDLRARKKKSEPTVQVDKSGKYSNKNFQSDSVRAVHLCDARKLPFCHTNSHRIHCG